ncbi:OadG family protein [candidate division KSB1 bacterium]|nr:OadG family protein [candidate division KSB1 bacterium]
MIETKLLGMGVNIGVLGISVVFSSLIILLYSMKLFVFLLKRYGKTVEKKAPGLLIKGVEGNEPLSGEIVSAISLAIHMSHEEYHDLERAIITFNRMTRPYSPWSSKIHAIQYTTIDRTKMR